MDSNAQNTENTTAKDIQTKANSANTTQKDESTAISKVNSTANTTQQSTQVQNFDSILKALIEDANLSGTKREKGKLFERLTAKLLQSLPIFKEDFKEVYLWSEFNAKFGINKGDFGIDIMALTTDNKWVSVQCKALDTEHKISQGDLKGFLGIDILKSNSESFEISQKLIFHTCKQTSENYENALKSTKPEAKSYGYKELKEDFGIKWDEFTLDDLSSLKLLGKKALRDYQNEALNAIKDSFITQNESRAKLIMACGTGKSLLSIRTIDELVGQNELALFFAPSLALSAINVDLSVNF